MFLSEIDLKELTGKTQKAAQVRALKMMGIRYWLRPDGSAAVSKNLLDTENPAPVKKPTQPNWDCVK